MKTFVLDASVALGWFVDNPTPPYANRIRQALLAGDRAIVPALWQLEMANGLTMAERRGILTGDDADQSVAMIELLLNQSITETSQAVSMNRVHSAARSLRLTAYDALYLESARAQSLPLATLDRALLAAAIKTGVELVK